MSLRERFEQKIMFEPMTGCWFWTGSTLASGHGQISVRTKFNMKAHRLSFEFYKGPIPDGLDVCHHCDEPSCVNPDHLYAGTHQQNMNDRERRGRGVRLTGEANGASKLSYEQVRQIRAGMRTKDAVSQFGICRTTIKNIRNNKIWKGI